MRELLERLFRSSDQDSEPIHPGGWAQIFILVMTVLVIFAAMYALTVL
jgi:hypothetical protein